MSALDALIDHWRLYEPSDASWLHRRDAPFLNSHSLPVHADVSAYPYVGDLKRADVWLCMLNSKLGRHDSDEESSEPYKSLFRKNLRQELAEEEFPLLSLNPVLQNTGTFQYYNYDRGLAALVEEFARAKGVSELNARRVCSSRLAILELLPYRSETFPTALKTLPSVNLARRAAQEASATKLLIVPWGLSSWGLKNSDNVRNKPARAFTFAPHGSAGYGKAIVERLLGSS